MVLRVRQGPEDVGKPLAPVAFLSEGLSVSMNSRPKIPLADNLVSKGASARMVAANALVDFPQDVVAFLWCQAPEVRKAEPMLVESVIDD